MCGIGGVVSFDKAFRDSCINTISNGISNRGPDHKGNFSYKNLSLTHRLLKIMDLSDNSHQPMISNNDNVIIFNGSIYNYHNLKTNHLQDHSFKTNTDTEVLLELFNKYDVGFTKYLKGMFSIAIFKKSTQQLFLFRDQFAIKPLFYYHNNNNLIFSSDLRSLTKIKDIFSNCSVNYQEVSRFISYRHHSYKNQTLINGIKELSPGTYAEIDLSKISFKENKFDQYKKKFDENICFKNILYNSIKEHSITEHDRLASLLSGGLDSTLLSILLQKFNKDKKISTFSIIEDKPNPENILINKIVKEFNFDAHFIYESEINFFNRFTDTNNILSYPTIDSSMIMHNLLCEKVSQNGFKVLYTGNGADEIFYGYPNHISSYLANLLMTSPIDFFREIFFLRKKTNKTIFNLILKSIRDTLPIKYQNLIKSITIKKDSKLYDFDLKKFTPNFSIEFSDSLFLNSSQNYLNHWALRPYLEYEDKNSMFYGIEARVPYLDLELYNYVAQKNLSKNFSLGTKSLLRSIVDVPQYIRNFKGKFGFAGSLYNFMQKDLLKFKELMFYDDKLKIFNTNEVMQLFKNFDKNYEKIFRIISLSYWYSTLT